MKAPFCGSSETNNEETGDELLKKDDKPNEHKENELFVPFKFVDNKCCGIMDERMKRKYTEMIFHFFQEYLPGTRIYEGKCR